MQNVSDVVGVEVNGNKNELIRYGNARLMQQLHFALLGRLDIQLEDPGVFNNLFETVRSAIIACSQENDLGNVLQ
jgi:hypothetical protein